MAWRGLGWLDGRSVGRSVARALLLCDCAMQQPGALVEKSSAQFVEHQLVVFGWALVADGTGRDGWMFLTAEPIGAGGFDFSGGMN